MTHPKAFKRLLESGESPAPYSAQPDPVSPSAAATSALLNHVYLSPTIAVQIIKAIEEGRIPGIKATY